MKKRITALALALVFCVCLLPVTGYAEVSESVLDPAAFAPKNVEVQFQGTGTDASGQNVLDMTVTWDDDESILYCELYPFVEDGNGGLFFLSPTNGPTIVRQGADASAPESVQWTTQNGRNSIKLSVPILGENEQQFTATQSGGTTYYSANGLKENNVGVILMTAVMNPYLWSESEYSSPVVFTYTKLNADQRAVFTQAPTVGTNKAPTVNGVLYDAETTELAVSFTTEDVESRYFETLMLVKEEIENHMGMFTISGVVYYLLGIMSFDEDQSCVSVDKETGYAMINGEQYFGQNEEPKIGDELYIAVQTEGAHPEGDWGEGSEVSEPVKITVGEVGSPKDLVDLSQAEVTGTKPEGEWYTTDEMKELALTWAGRTLSEGEEYTSEIASEESEGETTSTKTFRPVWGKSKGKKQFRVKAAP